jgi:hypothetical protein
MYCDIAEWRCIRRRILEKGTPKKQVSRETGISRATINKILAHEEPPGYRPRSPHYPKLGPYIPTIERLLHDAVTSSSAGCTTIRDIADHLRCKEGFGGSYDSVRNYARQRVRSDDGLWERAYDLIIRLPKPRALELVRLLSAGKPPFFFVHAASTIRA